MSGWFQTFGVCTKFRIRFFLAKTTYRLLSTMFLASRWQNGPIPTPVVRSSFYSSLSSLLRPLFKAPRKLLDFTALWIGVWRYANEGPQACADHCSSCWLICLVILVNSHGYFSLHRPFDTSLWSVSVLPFMDITLPSVRFVSMLLLLL